MRSNTAMWDFWSLSPESLHQITILFSDRGLPQSYRFVHGFGSHTYSFINSNNERFWVKFHFKTAQGIKNWTNEEASKVVGTDRESSQRDLFNAIEKGDFPRWNFKIQIMTEDEAENYHINPFDLTKVWPHGDFPLIDVGVIELNRNPENYFAEIEQASFEPSNIVSGISFSPDKMLQARIMSYADAHRYRIGVNYASLPINQPKTEVNNYHRDGNMRFDGNNGGAVNYEPNSMGGPKQNSVYNEPPLKISGDADRYDHREDEDYYSQPAALFNLMNENQKDQLINNFAAGMEGVPERIKVRQLTHFYKANPVWGKGVATALNMENIDFEKWASKTFNDLVESTTEENYK